MDSLLCALFLASLMGYAHGQSLLPNNCTGFDPAPMDLVLVMGSDEMACLECDYPDSFNPAWALMTETGFSIIASGSRDDECDCSIENNQLCFSDIDASAIRQYRCAVTSSDNLVIRQCQFDIHAATLPVITPTSPQAITRRKDEEAVFTFDYQPGNPAGTVVWSKDGNEIVNGGKYSINPTTMSLTVSEIEANDRGIYTVTITNIAGSDALNYSLFVHFVEITSFQITDFSEGTVTIECVAVGYPDTKSNATSRDDGLLSSGASFTHKPFDIVNTLTDEIAEDCADQITCIATARIPPNDEVDTKHLVPCGTTAPVIQTVDDPDPDTFDSVIVRWTSSALNFNVRYWVKGLPEGAVTVPSVTGSEYTIQGLTPGQTYFVEVCSATVGCSQPFMFTVNSCDSSLQEAIRGVEAFTVSENSERTIIVTWTASQEPGVTGYRLSVSPCPNNAPCTPIVSGSGTTSYRFPPTICGGAYHFRVQAVTECGGTGPRSAMVVEECDVLNQLSDVDPLSDGFTLLWNFVDPPVELNITAQNIVPDKDNKITTLVFQVAQSDIASNMACIGGLEPSTFYTVCLAPVFNLGDSPNRFCSTLQTLDSNGDSAGSCLMFVSRATTDPGFDPTLTPTIQNWHIALIVVGALAIIAMVFCLVGLCFACQTSKQKGDFGSNESLSTTYNTNSVKDGISMQRSMSPTRSCLSYHHKGHSTNWNDHVDTLRQMETVDGTNV